MGAKPPFPPCNPLKGANPAVAKPRGKKVALDDLPTQFTGMD
ncbi:hypothetical protein [uncultured Helicobacter sp.]|nr:hypothetical protein [uncultured Helicobacter sp.]